MLIFSKAVYQYDTANSELTGIMIDMPRCLFKQEVLKL